VEAQQAGAERAVLKERVSSFMGPDVKTAGSQRSFSRLRSRSKDIAEAHSGHERSDSDKPLATDDGGPRPATLGSGPSALGRARVRQPPSKAGMSQIRQASSRRRTLTNEDALPRAPPPVPMKWKLLNCFSINRNWTLLFAPVRKGDYNFFDGYRSLRWVSAARQID